MLQFFRKVWQRLWGRLRYCGAVHYLAGGPSLPPPLTPEQEKALLDRMAAGDAAAREELITHNLRLVVYLAKKYENSGVPAEDLVSIGTIGLIKAVNTFTPARTVALWAAMYSPSCTARCSGSAFISRLPAFQLCNGITYAPPGRIMSAGLTFCPTARILWADIKTGAP